MLSYKGHKWIKVKRHIYDPDKSWEENYKDFENHHIEECNFLINEVRELADQINAYQERDLNNFD